MIIQHAVPGWDELDIRTILLQLCYPYDIRSARVRLFSLLRASHTYHTSANHTVRSVRFI